MLVRACALCRDTSRTHIRACTPGRSPRVLCKHPLSYVFCFSARPTFCSFLNAPRYSRYAAVMCARARATCVLTDFFAGNRIWVASSWSLPKRYALCCLGVVIIGGVRPSRYPHLVPCSWRVRTACLLCPGIRHCLSCPTRCLRCVRVSCPVCPSPAESGEERSGAERKGEEWIEGRGKEWNVHERKS